MKSERSIHSLREAAFTLAMFACSFLCVSRLVAQKDDAKRQLDESIRSAMERYDLPSVGIVVRGNGNSHRAAYVRSSGRKIERSDDSAFDVAPLVEVLGRGRADTGPILELERRARALESAAPRRVTPHLSSWEGRRVKVPSVPKTGLWVDLDGLDRLLDFLIEKRELVMDAVLVRPRASLGLGWRLETGRSGDGQITTIRASAGGATTVLILDAKARTAVLVVAGLADADAALIALADSARGTRATAADGLTNLETTGATQSLDGSLWSDGSTFIELRRRPDHWIMDTGFAAFRLRAPEGKDLSLDPRTGRLDIAIEGRQLRIDVATFKRIEDPGKEVPMPELLGHYVDGEKSTVSIAERYGVLWWVEDHSSALPIELIDENAVQFTRGDRALARVDLIRDERKHVTRLECGRRSLIRASPQPGEGDSFRIVPRKTIEVLRADADKASPPRESGKRSASKLIDLATVNRSIRFDIRYATKDNFMGEPFYAEPRAFMVEDAARAVGRVAAKLERLGIGLLVHDAYRPWSVTHMFWNATPPEQREFVANPASGSRHNRGCAVDTGLYDLSTKSKITMPSGYDEFTERAWPDWQGGTTAERAFRATLRRAMEEQGFRVYDVEWWHFDYEAWREYPIRNESFDEIDRR